MLVGHWRGTETVHPSPWDRDGGTACGRADSRLALDGFAVITDYWQERGGCTSFEGHGVMTYDANREAYVLHWFDSLGSPPEVFTGDFEGDVLTLSHGGPPMHARLVYDFTTARVLRSRMEMSTDGEEWTTLFECEYRRSDA